MGESYLECRNVPRPGCGKRATKAWSRSPYFKRPLFPPEGGHGRRMVARTASIARISRILEPLYVRTRRDARAVSSRIIEG